MSVSPTRFITPTYQSNLNFVIHEVLVALNRGEHWIAWYGLQTLYDTCHPDVQEECEKEWNEIHDGLRKILGTGDINVVLGQHGKERQTTRFLRNHNRPFFRKIMATLFDKGYLEKMPLTPRYTKERKLEV